MWSSQPPGGDAERRGQGGGMITQAVHQHPCEFQYGTKVPSLGVTAGSHEEGQRRKRRETHGCGGNRGDEGGLSDVSTSRGRQ